jgi:monoamine oxidase
MAGLTAAYYLEKAGLRVELFESDSRVGGRVRSAQNLLAAGIVTELGGEFIDSHHTDIMTLCRAFDLPLLDTKAPTERQLIRTRYVFGGQHISEPDIIRAFTPFAERIRRDGQHLAGSSAQKNLAISQLDRLSIDAYLAQLGMSGWLSALISTSFTSEFGLSAGEQSCLNLLAILSPDTTRGFEVYGESDERYKVVGGNERIITELGQRLKSPVQTGFHLERMVQKSSGYQLSFANGRQTEVDYVVMTLPFSVLRTIQFEMPISARKRQCIQELGYGTVSKLFIGVTERVWRRDGYSGIAISDQIQNGWDSSHMQQANTGPGGYTLLLGGEQGRRLTINQFDSYLAGCNQVFSGMNQATNGQKNLYNWTANPLARGAYACYKVGQMTTIGRAEGERAGNVLFAGEHCSRRFQGYMNGAAETGRRAAEDIATELGVSSFQSVRREKVSGQ